jgi:predicted ribosome quality control (RQC) complex YloA/Tae2 family protein
MLKHKHRLKVGDKYTTIEHRLDPMKIEREDLYPLLNTDDIEEWFATNIALPNNILRLILDDAKIKECKDEKDVDQLYNSLIKIRDDIREGRRSLIVDDERYLEAIDRKFSSIILERLEKEDNEDQREELMKRINAKEMKKLELIRRAKEIRKLADRFASNNADEEDLKQVIALKIKDKGSVYSIASRLYDRAKGLERGIKKIDLSIKKSREELTNKVNKVKEKKDREWFERYRWFVTSDNILAVGGRDASSNDILLKRYAKEDDLIFHADIHGSPFFVLKDAKEDSIREVSIATASFSRAWREGLNVIDVYYVKKAQLRKSNKKGAFAISGKRNYIKNVELKLGVGVIEYNNKKYLIVAPINIFDKCIVIKPDNDKTSIKELRDRLMYIDKEFIESISIDDIIRILPSGNIRII